MLLSCGSFDGGDDLTGNAQLREGAEGRKPVLAEIADGLVQIDEGLVQMEDGRKQINAAQAAIDEGRKIISNKKKATN